MHISTRRTAVQPVPTTLALKTPCHADEETKRVLESLPHLQTVACSNYFEVDDKVGVANKTKNDIYHTTRKTTVSVCHGKIVSLFKSWRKEYTGMKLVTG